MIIFAIMRRSAKPLRREDTLRRFWNQTSATTLGADALRFLVAGVINTALTLILYQILLIFFSAHYSYLLAWFAGLLLVVMLYPDKVFPGGRRDFASRILFGGIYAIVLLAGLGLLSLLGHLGVSARLSILFVIPITTALNLALGRLFLRGRLV